MGPEKRLDKFLTEEFKHLDVKPSNPGRRPGAPDRWLPPAESGTDLIMMPTHGLSVFRRLHYRFDHGQGAPRCRVRRLDRAHLESAPALEAIAFRKVMCAVDMGPQSENALRWAAGFAQEHSAELVVVHVVPAAEAGPAKYLDQRFVLELSAQMRVELRSLLEKLGIVARIVVVGGDPAKAVGQIAQSESVDQLVIARGAVAETFGRLRTNAYAIIRSAPCPVVSV